LGPLGASDGPRSTRCSRPCALRARCRDLPAYASSSRPRRTNSRASCNRSKRTPQEAREALAGSPATSANRDRVFALNGHPPSRRAESYCATAVTIPPNRDQDAGRGSERRPHLNVLRRQSARAFRNFYPWRGILSEWKRYPWKKRYPWNWKSFHPLPSAMTPALTCLRISVKN
jgi:hypothetical protein